MKLRSLTVAAFLLAAAPAAAAAPLASQDAAYLKTAMQAQLGRYALASTTARHGSGAVKSLAQSIAKDASANTRKLDALAKRYGVPVAKQAGFLDTYHYSQMQGLSGSELDRRFVMDVRTDDGMELSSVKTEMHSGQDSALKAYAKRRYAAMRAELARLKHV